ncbi:unnamed protein product [Fraxinus pennsylvanica]|uniref:Uncharacterized protein n=1 Tax=Fraxinus pennsylvanica TaxID=56036 RepID=A0AAD1ZET8_9LAMI|nr:unnamed protein product [Fraxinus pennsylvanica]
MTSLIVIETVLAAKVTPLLMNWVNRENPDGKSTKDSHLVVSVAFVVMVLGSVVSGGDVRFSLARINRNWILLNIKGHFQVYLALIASNMKLTSISTSISMVFVTLLTIVYLPFVVTNIIDRARKHSPTQRMALQWHSPIDELQILLYIHGSQIVLSAKNFMEISQGLAEPGIMVFLTDVIELTDRISAALTHNEGADGLTVTDPTVVGMREQITNAVNDYLNKDGDGINVRRMLALSTMNSMHHDICILAKDLMVSLIVLPFHKQQEAG